MISVDNPEDNKKFAEAEDADYPILSDPSKEIATKYGVIGRFGVANRWTFYIAPDGKILHIDTAVKPATAGPDMIAKLAELKIKKK
jgi:peroxiredoxin Q/BCP